MANWWETEANLPPAVAGFQRRAAYFRQLLDIQPTLQARYQQLWQTPDQTSDQALPDTELQRTPGQAPGAQSPYSFMDMWQFAQAQRGAEPTGPASYMNDLSFLNQRKLALALQKGELVPASTLPSEPTAEQLIGEYEKGFGESFVGEEYEERGRRTVSQYIYGQEPEEPLPKPHPVYPKWLRTIGRVWQLWLSHAIGRVIRSWETPEKRARLGGSPEGLGTKEELEPSEDWQLEEAKARGIPVETPNAVEWLARVLTGEKVSSVEPSEYLIPPEERERLVEEKYQQLPKLLKDIEIAGHRVDMGPLGGEDIARFMVDFQIASKGWEALTESSEPARVIEQTAAVGGQLLQEGAFLGLETAMAIQVMSRPESEDLEVDQWYSLGHRAASLFYKQMRARINNEIELRMGKTDIDWHDVGPEEMPEQYLIAKSLLDIAEGKATAEEIALTNENLWAEVVGQILADPANITWFRGPAKLRLKHLEAAKAKYVAEAAEGSSRAKQALKVLEDALDGLTADELVQVEGALAKTNQSFPVRTWNRLKELIRDPKEFLLTPETRALRVLDDVSPILTPALDIAESGEDVLALLRLWADDPEVLKPVFGRVPTSVGGKKASLLLKATIDELAQLPSFRARPFNPARAWVDMNDVFDKALRAAYQVAEPGPVKRFFLAYKRLMAEFYLNPATGGIGYGVKNAAGDMSGMGLDGLLTFASRDDIDAFYRQFGTIAEGKAARRLWTEGAESIAGLTGGAEPQSILPGPLGRWSKAGQKFQRQGEILKRFPWGEEPRYLRAHYKGMKRFWELNAAEYLPELPASAYLEYGRQADLLYMRIAHEPDPAVRHQLLQEFLDGTGRADIFEPLKYLDPTEMDAMSPTILRKLRNEFGTLTRESEPNDIRRIMRAIADVVDEDEAARLAAMEDLPPRLHVTTDVEEVEIHEALVDELEDIVARTGDDDLATRLEEIKDEIPEIERRFDDARASAVDDLLDEPADDGLEILMRANSRAEDARIKWRKRVDEIRNEAIARYNASPQDAPAIWRKAFLDIDKAWREMAFERAGIFDQAKGHLRRFRAGEDLDDILGDSARQARAERMLLAASQDVPEAPKGYMPGKVFRSGENAKFQRFLDHKRAVLDRARTNAWRAVYGAEPEDYGRILDLLDSADRDVELWGKQGAAKARQHLADTQKKVRKAYKTHRDPHMAKLAADRLWEQYYALRHDTWNLVWVGSEQRWQIAERDILYANWERRVGAVESPVSPPNVRRAKAVPDVGPVQPGDEELVKAAARLADSKWTPEQKAAVKRWTSFGNSMPQQEAAILPGSADVPVYTRSDLVSDLKAMPYWTEEQVDEIMRAYDQWTAYWSKMTGRPPEEWYARNIAGAFRGSHPDIFLFQRGDPPGTPQFHRWFGDSVLVDDAGEPMDLYHGTVHTFDRFREGQEGGFIWLTDEPDYANFIAGRGGDWWDDLYPEGAQLHRLHARMEYPLDLSTATLDLPLDEFEAELADALAMHGIMYGKDVSDINATITVPGGFFGFQAIAVDEPFLWVRYNAKKLRELCEMQGFDGIILAEQYPVGGGERAFARSYIIFEPEQAKTAWNVHPTWGNLLLHQGSEIAPRWWYRAEQIVDARMPARADIEQIRNILTRGGVKKDELRWSGVLRWLDNQEGMLTKEDVLGFLQGNRLEVSEVRRGFIDEPELLRAREAYARAQADLDYAVRGLEREATEAGVDPDKWRRLVYEARELNSPTSRLEMDQLLPGSWERYQTALDQRQAAHQQWQRETGRNVKSTQWGKYVEPGAVRGTYRELELTLPEWMGEDALRVQEMRRLNAEISEHYNEMSRVRQEAWLARNRGGVAGAAEVPEELATRLENLETKWKELHARRDTLSEALGDPVEYAESHWSGDQNVVAHVRFNERTGPNGERLCHIEEGQSRWHQTGRKEGYMPSKWPDDWEIRKPTKEEAYKWDTLVAGETERLVINDRIPSWTDWWIGRDANTGQWRVWENFTNRGIFATKAEARAAAFAQAPEAELLVCIDGKGNVLARGIDEGAVKRNLAGTKPPEAPFANTWDELFLKRMMRYAAENDYDAITWTSGAQQVRRYPMEERAVVTRLEWQRMDDNSFLVTGYDDLKYAGNQTFRAIFSPDGTGEILNRPTTLEEAFGKELLEDMLASPPGEHMFAQVGELVVGDRRLAELYDRIFPFSANKLTKRWGVSAKPVNLSFGDVPDWHVTNGFQGYIVMDDANRVISPSEFGTRVQAIEWMQGELARYGSHQVFHLPITPGMKRDLLDEGLPLFQQMSASKKGAVSFMEDGRALLHFFEGADVTTAIHEMLGHLVRKSLPKADLRIVEEWVGLAEGEFDHLFDLAVEYHELSLIREPSEEVATRIAAIKPRAEKYIAAEEQWARGIERYFAEGVAPTPELESTFRKIRRWILEVYEGIKGTSIDVKISDEVRGLMDRIWSAEVDEAAELGVVQPPAGGGPPLFQAAEPVRSDAFKRWFGDSKVVGEGGEPLRLYRGMDVDVKSFTPSQEGLIWTTDNPEYAEFIASKAYGQEAMGGRYAEGAQIYPVYVKLENPIDFSEISANLHPTLMQQRLREVLARYNIRYGIDVSAIGKPVYGKWGKVSVDELYQWVRYNAERLCHFADEGGYDGIVLSERFRTASGKSSTAKSYVAFEPEQVKSVFVQEPSSGPMLFQEAATRVGEQLSPDDVDNLAELALKNVKEGGWTLAADGTPYSGKGWAVSVPDAETPLPAAQVTKDEINQWLEQWGDVLSLGRDFKFGGWVDGETLYLDITTIIEDADEAMVKGWDWGQKGIFSFDTWETTEVTYEAAQEAAERLGITLQRAPGEPATPLARGPLFQAETAQPPLRGVDPNRWRAYQRGLNQPGATEGPLPQDLLSRSTDLTRQALRKIEEGVLGEWDSWQPKIASQQVRREMEDWFAKEAMPSWFEQRAVAFDYATAQANFALLNYANRYVFDELINGIIPYHYWYTRAGLNWAKRLYDRPWLLSYYIRARDALKLANENAGRRQRFEGMIPVPAPWLPGWMGDKLLVDPSSLIAPFSQIYGTDWDDADDSRRGLSRLFSTARNFGLRPYHIYELPYQLGLFQKLGETAGMNPEDAKQMLGPDYPGNFGYVLPQTGVIKGATSLAREMGAEGIQPGGINIEAPARRLVGLPAGEIWDPYRTNRMLGNIAAEDPRNMALTQAILRAQELVDRDKKEQTGKPWDPTSGLAMQTAKELGWTDEQLAEAQEVLAEAVQKAALERGVGAAGWMIGARLAVEPRGERAQLEMAEEAREQVWTPGQPEGSREAYEQFKREYPAMYPRATQYQVMPGEKDYEAMSPGYRANWLALRQQKEWLHEEYDKAVDEVLRATPWNWDARDAIEAQRREEIAQLEEQYPLPEFEGEMPAILYGMNPTEMWNAVVEKELYRLQTSKPLWESFDTEEGVDESAYYNAVTKWRAQLPKMFSFGIPRDGLYAWMEPGEAMQNFEQRYDSPLEAAYKVYQQEVARPAWDAYDKAKAQREAQWPGLAELEDRYWQLDQNSRRAHIQTHPELKEYWDWKDRQPATPYESTVGQVPAMPAEALIPAILSQYKTRGWNEEQLRYELEGVLFPSLAKQVELRRGETSGRAEAEGTGAGGAAGATAYQRPQYTPGELEYMKRKVLEQWEKKQGGRRSWGEDGGGGGYPSRYSKTYYPRWRPPPMLRGGPFSY